MAASREHRLLLCGDSAGGVFALHLPDAVTAGQPSISEAGSADVCQILGRRAVKLGFLHHLCAPVIAAGANQRALNLIVSVACSVEAQDKAICHLNDHQRSQ